MKFLKNYIFHILAFVIVSIWGATFVSTKILINRGLGPIDIMFYRFVMAYICVSAVYHKKIFADNLKDEFLLFIMGITGGSLYFLAENTALQYTFASNVALLTCTAPLLTALVIRMVYKNEPLTKNFIYGSFIALLGVALVILYNRLITIGIIILDKLKRRMTFVIFGKIGGHLQRTINRNQQSELMTKRTVHTRLRNIRSEERRVGKEC